MSFFILFIFTRYRFFLRPSNGVWNCAFGAHFPTPLNHQDAISRSIFLGCKIAAPEFRRNFPKFGGRYFAPQRAGVQNCGHYRIWGAKLRPPLYINVVFFFSLIFGIGNRGFVLS